MRLCVYEGARREATGAQRDSRLYVRSQTHKVIRKATKACLTVVHSGHLSQIVHSREEDVEGTER